MGPVEWILLLILSFIWGASFFLGKVAVAAIPPLTIVLVRVGIAAIVMNLFMVFSGRRMPGSLKMWTGFLVMGLLNNMIPFSLIFWGQIKIASGLASILNATTPLWTVMLAHFLTRDEKLNPGRLSGVILGIIGVIIIIGPDVLKGFGANAFAQLAVVGAAISYAFAGIFGKQFKKESPYVMATGQLTCSALLMIPVSLVIDKPWTLSNPGVNIWTCMLTLALVCTALAYILYFKILSSAGATNLMLVTFLIPVSAMLLGIFLLGERLDLRHYLGMATIALGLIAIDGRVKRYITSKLGGLDCDGECIPPSDSTELVKDLQRG